MNKTLPIVLIVVIGLGIAAGAFLFFNKKDSGKNTTAKEKAETETFRELPLDERPFVTLTPRADGHEFHLTIQKIPKDSEIVEYELVYKNSDGVTQGVPGSIKYKGESKIERDLLLGSCSSGKCKYDEGVEEGSFTLKLRDDNGKLITKLDTGFHLQQNPRKITSSDDKFSLSGTFAAGYYLTMGTLGLPEKAPGTVSSGPYGVFTKSASKSLSATVDLSGKAYVYTTKWVELSGNKTSSLGTFITTQ